MTEAMKLTLVTPEGYDLPNEVLKQQTVTRGDPVRR
jgi:hypothetical protein